MAGITPMVPSVEAMPQITRSGAAFLIASASTKLRCQGIGAMHGVIDDVDACGCAHL